jgi:hypothetical protein
VSKPVTNPLPVALLAMAGHKAISMINAAFPNAFLSERFLGLGRTRCTPAGSIC